MEHQMSTHEAVRPDKRGQSVQSPDRGRAGAVLCRATRALSVASLEGIEGAHIISRYEDVKFALDILRSSRRTSLPSTSARTAR